MLLTTNDAALQLLFDNKILQHEKTVVLFGSDFPQDQSDLSIYLNIQRKCCSFAKKKKKTIMSPLNQREIEHERENRTKKENKRKEKRKKAWERERRKEEEQRQLYCLSFYLFEHST